MLVKATMVYPSIVVTQPDKAECPVWGRKTKTMFIVEKKGEVVKLRETGSTPTFGYTLPMRFNLKTGRPVGYSCMINSWRIKSFDEEGK